MAMFTCSNGVQLSYEDHNPQAGTCVAFLNGVMASLRSWQAQSDLFRRLGYRVILHDFKGQLLSDKPDAAYSLAEHAAEARELFRFLGVERPHLVGTSYGGEVALRYAIDYPDEPASITVIDSVAELNTLTRMTVEEWRRLAADGDAERFFRAILPSIYGDAYLAANGAMLEKRARAMASLDPSYLAGQLRLYDAFLAGADCSRELSGIGCPCMLICGGEDRLKPPEFSIAMARSIPGAELALLPDCGHVAILEQPEVVNSLILGFIAKQAVVADS